ncbi:MAG: alpha/beta hydrolase-fold protein [Phycisphaerales bacterium]|nr:alpha/beta hydrolase-fold protein [Phycisphaerales bacterium]
MATWKYFAATAVLGLVWVSSAIAGGLQSTQYINVDGLSRQYLIYLPVDFSEDENMPVMMWHHGGGGTANGGIYEADFRSLADSERFIAVYAQAYPDVLEGCTCWGYEEPGGYENGNWEIDLAYTSAVIDDLVDSFNANRSRIYAGGYSMGGSYVWDLACNKSDEIAAVAPVAASMYQWTLDLCDSAASTAICHILGTNDFYAPYDGGWVPSAAEQHTYWVDKNDSEPTPEVVNLGGGVTRYTWAEQAESCHAVQHFKRQGGGHDVPSFAVSVIWEFVSRHELDGVTDCIETECSGDLNGDDAVGVDDLLGVIAGWGGPNGDVDGNGTTTVDDLLLVISEWGNTCP